MKKNILITLFSILFLSTYSKAEFGIWASAIYLNVNGSSQFYNTQLLNDPNSIGTVNFTGSLGTFTANTNTLIIGGAEVKTYKNNGGNVCGGTLYYTVYPLGARPASPTFTGLGLDFYCDCANDNTFNSCGGGTCTYQSDQKWQKVGQTNDLTQLAPGDYTIEIYYQISGAATSSACGETRYDSNSGSNYTANFSITANLPVNFTGIFGDIENGIVHLKWSSQSDEDVVQYEIEKSSDGIHFSTLGSVNSQRSSDPFTYSLSDISPVSGNNYYRVRLVRLDNTIGYSKVLRIEYNKQSGHLLVLPYRSGKELPVKLSSIDKGSYQLVIINNIGQQIAKQTITHDGSIQIITLPLNNKLSRGVYRLILKNRSVRFNETFIVE